MFSRDIQVQHSMIIIVNEVYSTTQSIEMNVKTYLYIYFTLINHNIKTTDRWSEHWLYHYNGIY